MVFIGSTNNVSLSMPRFVRNNSTKIQTNGIGITGGGDFL
jgi:hypothetical protein